MDKPIRVQRRRVKGWRMPPNTIYVGRPTKFGNPFKVGYKGLSAQDCVNLFEVVAHRLPVHELKGKNLSCFCPLDKPCHADVLLKIANQ